MIPPAGWRAHAGAGVVALVPPDGGGRVRCHERLPAAPLSQVISRLLAADPSFRATGTLAVEPLVTAESEYATLVTLAGVLANRAVVRVIGVVTTDDVAAAIDGLACAPDALHAIEQATRLMTSQLALGLGERRRRFLYPAPRASGWQALARGLVTTWYAPGYPRNATVITVPPTTPCLFTAAELSAALTAEDAVYGMATTDDSPGVPFVSDHGLAGERRTVRLVRETGDEVVRELIVCVADERGYMLRLDALSEADFAAHLPDLLAMASGAQPLPPRPSVKAAARVAVHWVD